MTTKPVFRFRAATTVAVGAIVGSAAGFLGSVLLGHHLGVEDFGRLSAAFATIGLISPIAGAGLGKALLTYPDAAGAPRVPIHALTLWSLLLATIAIPFVQQTAGLATLSAAALSLLVVGMAAGDALHARLLLDARRLSAMAWTSLHNYGRLVAGMIATAGVGLVSVSYGVGAFGLSAATCGLLWLARTTTAEPTAATLSIRGAIPYALESALFVIYYQIDIAFLGALSTPVATGHYAAAVAILSLAYLVPSAILQKAVLPGLVSLPIEYHRRFSILSTGVGTIVGASFVLIYGLFGDQLLRMLFGADFGDAYTYLVLLLPALLLRFSYSGAATLLTVIDVQKKAQIVALAALVNILLNLLAVPLWGAAGAALSTVATESVLAIRILLPMLRRRPYLGDL